MEKLAIFIKKSIFFLVLTLPAFTYAVPEDQLPDLMTKIFDYYDQGQANFYTGVSGKQVHFHALKESHKTALIILPGRTEPTRKYAELVYDLRELSVDIFLWDPPGQGFSERLLEDPQKGYIESFKDYARDFNQFYKNELSGYRNVVIVAHSMGAAISLNFAANYSHKIKAMVLSSPMMQLKTNGMPETFALIAARTLSLIGKKKDYVPGGGPFKKPTPYQENRVTSSPNRYQLARTVDREDPKLYMGSATNNWLLQAIKLTHQIKRQRKKLKDIPLLFFQAGLDEFSKDKRQRKFCQKHGNCTLVRFEKSKHEMFQERDEIRDQVFKKTVDFLNPHLN